MYIKHIYSVQFGTEVLCISIVNILYNFFKGNFAIMFYKHVTNAATKVEPWNIRR